MAKLKGYAAFVVFLFKWGTLVMSTLAAIMVAFTCYAIARGVSWDGQIWLLVFGIVGLALFVSVHFGVRYVIKQIEEN